MWVPPTNVKACRPHYVPLPHRVFHIPKKKRVHLLSVNLAASSIVLTFLPTSGALKRPAMSKVNDCEQQDKYADTNEKILRQVNVVRWQRFDWNYMFFFTTFSLLSYVLSCTLAICYFERELCWSFSLLSHFAIFFFNGEKSYFDCRKSYSANRGHFKFCSIK